MSATRLINILMYLIMAAGVLFLVLVLYHGDDALEQSESLQRSVVDPFLIIGKYALYLTAAVAVIYSVLTLFKDPKGAVKSLIGIGGLGVAVLIAYLIADGSDYAMYATRDTEVDENTAHLVGMGLNTLYLVMGGTILSIVVVEVSRLFKR